MPCHGAGNVYVNINAKLFPAPFSPERKCKEILLAGLFITDTVLLSYVVYTEVLIFPPFSPSVGKT